MPLQPRIVSLFALGCSLLAGPVAQGQPRDDRPAPVRQFTNGLTWNVEGPAAFSQGDAYQVKAHVLPHPRYLDRQLTLLSGGLAVELRHPAGSHRTHELFKSGTPKVYKLNDGMDGVVASLDLRQAFGELKPGKWTARFILREGRYQVQGHTDASELVAEYNFEIVASTPDMAAKANTPSKEVTLAVPAAPDARSTGAAGTLTNNTAAAIEFSAYGAEFGEGKVKFEEPLTALVQMDRFVPPGSWSNVGLGYCGLGIATYRLEPGKSVKLRLNEEGGAQFTRYRLRFHSAGAREGSSSEAVSNVVEWPAAERAVAPGE